MRPARRTGFQQPHPEPAPRRFAFSRARQPASASVQHPIDRWPRARLWIEIHRPHHQPGPLRRNWCRRMASISPAPAWAMSVFDSVTNVGNRPTFGTDSFAVESHLLNFHPLEVTAETEVEIHFLDRLRDEIKFPSVEALREQIGRDVAKAQKVFPAIENKWIVNSGQWLNATPYENLILDSINYPLSTASHCCTIAGAWPSALSNFCVRRRPDNAELSWPPRSDGCWTPSTPCCTRSCWRMSCAISGCQKPPPDCSTR